MSHPAIVVVAYDRPASLRRLLSSLLAAEYPQATNLIISIDGGGDEEVARVAEEYPWPGSNKEIIRRTRNMGVREHVLACGDLTEYFDSIVVLEDDLFVSPMFYHFASQACDYYRDRPEIGGIGLYAYRRNLSTGMLFEPLIDESDVVFLQFACSWGQVWTADQWKPFRRWYHDHKDWDSQSSTVPRYVSHWSDSSWLKYHIKYLVETDRYFVSPRVSLSTCFQDAGQHTAAASLQHQVALQLSKREYRFRAFDKSFSVYDAWHTLVPEALNRIKPRLADYDYSIDFFGRRPVVELARPYVLGCWSSRQPIMTFGVHMRPLEMNVIAEVPGTGITLTRVADISRPVSLHQHAARIYPEFGIRMLFRMLRQKLYDKARRRMTK